MPAGFSGFGVTDFGSITGLFGSAATDAFFGDLSRIATFGAIVGVFSGGAGTASCQATIAIEPTTATPPAIKAGSIQSGLTAGFRAVYASVSTARVGQQPVPDGSAFRRLAGSIVGRRLPSTP